MLYERGKGGNYTAKTLKERNKKIFQLSKSGMSYSDISRLFFSHGVRLSPQRVGQIVKVLKTKENEDSAIDNS
jgi:pyruvate kinase